MRILISCIFTILCFTGYTQDARVVDKIVGKVGGEIILLSDIESSFNYINERQGGLLEQDFKCQILENFLADNLLVHQAKLDSVLVSDSQVEAELDARINSIIAQMGGDEAFFEEFYGKTVEQVKGDQRPQIRKKLMSDMKKQELLSQVKVTPKEVIDFYNKIPKDSIPFLNAEVELGELVLVPQVNAAERKRSLEKAENLRRQIVEEGADFAELAKKHSDDYGSGRFGGELGKQKRGGFVKEFEAAAFQLKKGEISEVVETEFGFHIIQLNNRIGNTIDTRHILIRPEITQADLDRARVKLDSIKTLIENDSLDFVTAVKRFGSKKSEFQSFHNNGKMQNTKTRDNFFDTADLPPEIYFAIESLKVGEITPPIEYTSSFGNETHFRIVQVQSRTKPHRANLQQDYNWIRTIAQENKMNDFLTNWIKTKVRSTYIEVDPAFSSCPNLLLFQGKKART